MTHAIGSKAGSSLLLGIDVVDVTRIGRMVDRYSGWELGTVFTPSERADAARARNRSRHYAVCFGAKEAVGKALGVGLSEIEWCDVEADVGRSMLGLRLDGRAAQLALQRGVEFWASSFAAWDHHVFVQVVGCGAPE
jgi:holo-[acyl-carrier protein] synthase